jgi:apurinic endonuclease APN1
MMIGLHVKRTPETLDNIKYYYDCCKINCIQIFLESPKKHRTGKLSDEKKKELSDIKNYCNEKKITIYVHGPYTINIGMTLTNKKSEKLDWWIYSFVKELKTASEFKMKGVVLHVGKSAGLEQKIAIKNMYDSLEIILKYLNKYDIELLIETPAGQGSEILHVFDDFLNFYKNLTKEMKTKIFLCLDTCHLFSSGTDLRTKTDVDKVMNNIKNTVGLSAIHLIHLNDSENPFNSRRDRHAPIGEGYIGIVGIKQIYSWARKYNISVILETPGDHPEQNLKLLNKW